jgi:excisionase family DNA binding protein
LDFVHDPAEDLDLQDAADALRVHYQTAYRWVRSGRLPARVVGGRYQVRRADLERLDDLRHKPATPPPPSAKRLAHQVDRMHEALLAGDETQAERICRRLVGDGTKLITLVQTVIAPALWRIGEAWHDGDLPIWAEHRASTTVERILAELSPNPRGRRRGVVAVAAVTGDHHALPTTMAAIVLREANWHVHHLGADTPPDELLRFCTHNDVDVAVLSVTNPACTALAEDTAERLRTAGIRCVVGAPGRTLEHLLVAVRDPEPAKPTAGQQSATRLRRRSARRAETTCGPDDESPR